MQRCFRSGRVGARVSLFLYAASSRDVLCARRVQSAGAALEELLIAAKKQDYLTVGVYESAKVMNV